MLDLSDAALSYFLMICILQGRSATATAVFAYLKKQHMLSKGISTVSIYCCLFFKKSINRTIKSCIN